MRSQAMFNTPGHRCPICGNDRSGIFQRKCYFTNDSSLVACHLAATVVRIDQSRKLILYKCDFDAAKNELAGLLKESGIQADLEEFHHPPKLGLIKIRWDRGRLFLTRV